MNKFIVFLGLAGIGGFAAYKFWPRESKEAVNVNDIGTDTTFLDNLDFSFMQGLIDVGSSIAVRQNNPLNIRTTNDAWQGLADPRSANGFFNFVSPEYGFRAARVIILNSYKKAGVTALAPIISRWAPPVENDTQNYIAFVVKKSGLKESTTITKDNIAKLLYAMAIIESGKTYGMDVIERSLSL